MIAPRKILEDQTWFHKRRLTLKRCNDLKSSTYVAVWHDTDSTKFLMLVSALLGTIVHAIASSTFYVQPILVD